MLVTSRVQRSLLIATALLGSAALLAGCSSTSSPSVKTTAAGSSSTSKAASSTPTPSASTSTPTGAPVHVSLLNADGATYGIGMPIIAYFNVAPTDAAAFQQATVVKVNGSAVQGNWYFEDTAHTGSALEGHWRPQTYWPAHASIELNLPVAGLSAGAGLVYDDSLTLSMSTGAANISTVDANTLQMTVTSDGATVGTYAVSLGANDTPTKNGIKVIMEKGASICMKGPGYNECGVKWTQRLTYDGEYLHAAPWNIKNLGRRSSSNGCTNLSPADAQTLYSTLNIGDVVMYPNANGPKMQLGDGYGDWNVSWPTWQSGGALTA